MKNWKDKVLGIFAGIGVMSLLMGFDQWQVDSGVRESSNGSSGWNFEVVYTGDGYEYFNQNSVTGEVYSWERSKNKWVRYASSMPSDLEVRY